jgi:hypothetical protein
MYLSLVGAVIAFGASANPTPALASDAIEPVPPPDLSVTEAIPPVPELEVDAVMADLEEPPIIVHADVEGGDIDVSVRVLSPENEPGAPLENAAGAIPGAIEPDITADPVLSDALPRVSEPIDDDTLDTNVAIRVLSPGRNGSVEQQSRPARDAAAAPTPDLAPAEGAEPADPTEELAETPENAPQYHDDNMQYQSDAIPSSDPWTWEWYLSLDCLGNVTSTSSELGSAASRDWDWKWTWDWTCGLDGASEESGDALQKGFASIASVSAPGGGLTTPGGDASAPGGETNAAAGEQPDASGTPWLWTWSFDFCGRATTFSIQTGENTNLDWTWDWTWAWACTSAEVVSPDAGGKGPSGTPADAGTPLGELELPAPLAIVIEDPLLRGIPFEAAPTVVVVAPIAIAPVIPLVRSSPSGTGPEQAPVSGPGRAPAQAPATVLIAVAPAADITTATPDTSQPERARPSKTRDREAAPRPARRLPQLPLGPTRRAAGSTSSGGAAPGGGGATGVAALTGLYVLAAPGLGRRIRVVRELSPHARAEAPRDRPG